MMIQSIMAMAQAKLNKKGVAIVEYAVLLAFVVLIGTAFLSSDSAGLASAIQAKITAVVEMLTPAAPEP